MARRLNSNLNVSFLLAIVIILVICIPQNGVYAFGAGNIPDFAYMEGRAFRHGDIEDSLSELIKRGTAAGGAFGLGALLGKGSKFGGLDVKRVYFGNWLRDYSQAVDIGALKKLQLQSIINLCMALGFLAHGYATHEFEVTPERLGVYLPTEHIDNPKGYGEGEDPRKYHPQLRGPVDPRELEIDQRTGMKNYIANENGSWDTSKALVRRTLERCIHHGRLHRANGQKQDEYEAYRLLGQSLHTLEDFSAHSNFCELMLVSLGFPVFVHVGDQVRIQAPNGKHVAPLVTGTFGSSDFIHSLLGEATDHISEASVSDLNKEINKARSKSGPGSTTNNLRELFFQLPGGGGNEMSREMDGVERIRAGPSSGGKSPEDMSPQELHAILWQVLTFRDSVVKKIENTIEKIPGLGPLIQKLNDSIQVFIYTTLEPYLKPIMRTATTGLMAASGEVINTHDQYEVFNDPLASDPTHSFLSKDHFNLILNEPAGNIAKVVVHHTVDLVVKAWDDPSINVHHVTEDVLHCLFHPEFHDPNSRIQREMMQRMREWVDSLGHNRHEIIGRLSKESVRNHQNIRIAGQGGAPAAAGGVAYNAAMDVRHDVSQYVHNTVSAIPGVSQAEHAYHKISQFTGGGPPGSRREISNPEMNVGGQYMPPPPPPFPSTYSAPPAIPPRPPYTQSPSSPSLYNTSNSERGPSFPPASGDNPLTSGDYTQHGHDQGHHGHHHHHHQHHQHDNYGQGQGQGYQPGYAPSYNPPPPLFPNPIRPSSPDFPWSAPPGGYDVPPPIGTPPYPPPQGPPPGFPGVPGSSWYPPPNGPPPPSAPQGGPGYYNNPPNNFGPSPGWR